MTYDAKQTFELVDAICCAGGKRREELMRKFFATVDASHFDKDKGEGTLQSPFLQVIENGDLEMATKMLALGANVNARRGKAWTMLHYAIKAQKLQMVELLIKYGADVNALERMEPSTTPVDPYEALINPAKYQRANGTITPLDRCDMLNPAHPEMRNVLIKAGAKKLDGRIWLGEHLP